jgi:hypothetical protein
MMGRPKIDQAQADEQAWIYVLLWKLGSQVQHKDAATTSELMGAGERPARKKARR